MTAIFADDAFAGNFFGRRQLSLELIFDIVSRANLYRTPLCLTVTISQDVVLFWATLFFGGS
jgi:hypothetical protein